LPDQFITSAEPVAACASLKRPGQSYPRLLVEESFMKKILPAKSDQRKPCVGKMGKLKI
jgi:hypothetical protein